MARLILIIDDEPQVLKSLRLTFESRKYEVATAESFDEAVDWLKGNSPSVVLSDFELPFSDGLELLEHVRKTHPATQRVLLTGHADMDLLQRALNAGSIQYFVEKPWDTEDLLGLIETAVSRYILRDRQEAMATLLKKQNTELEMMALRLETMVDHRTSQIERAKKQWERTFDAISDPLTLVSSDFVLERVNVAAAGHASKAVRDMPGLKCHGSLFGRAEPCDGCPLSDETVRWSAAGKAEAEIVDRNSGKTFTLSVFLLDREEGGTKYICSYKDITNQKQLQLQVMQSEKMAGIGQLAGGVAHELNNPIGVILSFTQFSKETALIIKDDELVDNLEEIEAAAKRCQKIVAGMLDFSRPSMDERMGLVDINESLEKALFLVSTQKATKSLEIQRDLTQSLPPVMGNENQLLQVFINLIQNAVQAMSEGGFLGLRTVLNPDGSIRTTISDTGGGIPRDNLNRLFEPFFTTKEPGKGTGLGLSVSYGILDRHSGRIEVESEEGKGATFHVTLPPAPVE